MLQRLAEGLEVNAQGGLARSIACTLGGLRRCEHTECTRVADVRGGGSEVGVIQHVGKRRFKPHLQVVVDTEDFRQPGVDRDGSRALEAADRRIAHAA